MGDVILEIIICVVIPSAFLCIFLDNKARLLMISFVSGVIACLLVYYLDNNILSKMLGGLSSYFVSTISPLIEELIKFIPIFFLIKKSAQELDAKSVVGLSFTVGVGFCVVENLYFLLYSVSSSGLVWIISRCIGTGLMHSISSTVIGLGLYYGFNDARLRFEFLLSAFCFAAMYHGLFNLLVQAQSFKFLGILIPILSYIVILYFIFKDSINRFLLVEENSKYENRIN